MKKIRQRGFTLLELVLVMTLISAGAIVTMKEKQLEMDQMQARSLGMELFRFNTAVQKFIAHKSGIKDPSEITGEYSGVDWLKDTSCGGEASSSFLACNYLKAGGKTTFGKLDFTTVITHNNVDGFTARTKMSQFKLSGKQRGDISGLAALVASGAYTVKDQPAPPLAQDGTVVYCPDIATMSASISDICKDDRDHIIMYARNLGNHDEWLRVDHGNVMQNVLEFRGGEDITPSTRTQMDVVDRTSRQIRNIARIYNLGDNGDNSENDNLILGKRYGANASTLATLTEESVIIDADQEILGQLIVMNTIKAGGEIRTTDGNIIAQDSGSGSVDAGNVIADHDVRAKDNLIADNHLFVGVDGTIGRDLNVIQDAIVGRDIGVERNAVVQHEIQSVLGNLRAENGEVWTKRFVDSKNPDFFVDPSGRSIQNLVDTNAIRSVNKNGNLEIQAGTIRFNNKDHDHNYNSALQETKFVGKVDVSQFMVKLASGAHVPLQELIPNYVHYATYFVHDGQTVGKPVCYPGGVPKVIITPMSVETNSRKFSASATYAGRWYAFAIESGGSWIIKMGSIVSPTQVSAGLVSTYCYY